MLNKPTVPGLDIVNPLKAGSQSGDADVRSLRQSDLDVPCRHATPREPVFHQATKLDRPMPTCSTAQPQIIGPQDNSRNCIRVWLALNCESAMQGTR